MIGRNASEGIEPRKRFLSRGARGWFSLKPAVWHPLSVRMSAPRRGRRPRQVIELLASELGRAWRLKAKRYQPQPSRRVYIPKDEHTQRPLGLPALEVRIQDPSLLLLIRRFLKAGYLEEGQLHPSEQGTPQGGNLSPVLANVFLHYVLDLWFAKKYRPQIRGDCHLVRYADDFLCLVQDEQDARDLVPALRARFAKFGLQLHPDKTRVIRMDRRGQNGRERQSHESRTFDFLGFSHSWGKSRRGHPVLCRKTSAKRMRRSLKQLNAWLQSIRHRAPVPVWWPTLQAKLQGHYRYYGVSGNSRSISRYGYIAVRLILKWLNRRSQRKSFPWEGFLAYLRHYPLPRPRIVHRLYPSPRVG